MIPLPKTKSALGMVAMLVALAGVAWCSNVAMAVVKPSVREGEAPTTPSATAPAPSAAGSMTLSVLEQLILQLDPKAQREGASWSLQFEGVPLKVVTDENADRMRVVCPVVRTSEMTEIQYLRVMEANFHTALDARYATSHGILFSAFIHRLSTLDAADFVSGAQQVARLAAGFGTSYSSGVMRFGQ